MAFQRKYKLTHHKLFVEKEASYDGPDFIGVGAPRAGTTWLYEVLRSHPNIWMPPIKELHYFDSIDPNVSFKRFTHEQWFRIKKYGNYRFRHYLASVVNKVSFNRIFDSNAIKTDYVWDKRFFGGGGGLAWYAGLFAAAKKKQLIAGEFTPDYALVNSSTAKLMADCNPNAKILLMLRNPIGRTWSNAVFYATRKLKRNVSDITDDEWVKYCFRKECLERSDYLRMYQNLSNVFKKEQIFIGFFDDVVNNPYELINDVYSFLQVEPFSPPRYVVSKDVNSSAKKHKSDIPKLVRAKLLSHFRDDMNILSKLLGTEIVAKWVKC
jgi:hypothetical protein